MNLSSYIERRDEDSHQSRSRSNSHLSSTTLQLQDLHIKPTTSSNQEEGTQSQEIPANLSTSSFLTPDLAPSSSDLISAPTPRHLTPFPEFSQEELDANWAYLGASEEPIVPSLPTPLLKFEPVQSLPRDPSLGNRPQSLSRSKTFPVKMSAVGIQQFDPRYDAGVQQSMTWPRKCKLHESGQWPMLISPGFDLSDQFISSQQMSPPMPTGTLNPYEDPKFMPMFSRSISSSPSRGSLTPEQRELKRQRDLSRRDSKVQMRRDRSTSNPYTLSPRPSPEMMSRSISDFSNALGQPSPLLSQGSQGSPNMSNLGSPSPSYLSQYTPQLGDSAPDMFGTAALYGMVPNDFSAIPNYGMGFTTDPMHTGLSSYVPRQHSHSLSSNDQPNMNMMHNIYGNPSPKMGQDSIGADGVRVVHSRPKPQCWDHGCNGRQFSTFSNLLRHQREKSGAATKSSCPNCGAEFTRTTARNGHMAHEKCKQRRST